jgi:hypothetical protein
VAYTTDAPVDSIGPAIDDNRALVMAEMPNVNAAVPASSSATVSTPTPDAGDLEIADVLAEQAVPTTEASEPIEAPSLRGAAIAKLLADKDRKPMIANKPCWDHPSCKEVQLGIPSPLPTLVGASSEPTAASTAGPSPDSPTGLSVDASTESSTNAPTDIPAGTPEETPTGVSADVAAEPSAV